MITSAQIRAARSLLDWTQAELAKKTGISLRALNSIERGLAVPRADNLRFIQEALEIAGIEFTEFNGVRQRTERLEIVQLEGGRYFDHHILDMMREMRTAGGEILYSFESEDEFDAMGSSLIDEYFIHLERHQITERLLIARGETYIMGAPWTYRWLPRSVFNHVGYIVYGDNVAFLIVSEPHRIIIIRNPAIAEMFRRQFEANWLVAEVPWFATEYTKEDRGETWSSAKGIDTRAWIETQKRKNNLGHL